MCGRYVELYSVLKLEKGKRKRINFINLFSLLGDENNFLRFYMVKKKFLKKSEEK